jgi:hypothetical protein
MTTNVTDLTSQQMASDSRWSIPKTEFLVYLDDSGFDKIVTQHDLALMFAGNAGVIQSWKDWLPIATENSPIPEVVGIAVCAVNLTTGQIVFESGQDIYPNEARFAGTGAFHAYNCWQVNGCPRKAVNSAKIVDIYSGGEVKYLVFSSKDTNVSNSTGVKDLHQMLATKGMVMYTNGFNGYQPGYVLGIEDAAKSDPEVAKIKDQIASGAVVASAPCGAMYNDWTEESKAKLEAAIKSVLFK